jgi:hypothetical protein
VDQNSTGIPSSITVPGAQGGSTSTSTATVSLTPETSLSATGSSTGQVTQSSGGLSASSSAFIDFALETFGPTNGFIPITVDATGSATVDVTSSPDSGGEASALFRVVESSFSGNSLIFDQALTDATSSTGDQTNSFADTNVYDFRANDYYVVGERVDGIGDLGSYDASIDPIFTIDPTFAAEGYSFILTTGIGNSAPTGPGPSVPDGGSTASMAGGALLCLAVLSKRRSLGARECF